MRDRTDGNEVGLALMRDPDGLAAKILAANNITTEEVRGRIVELLAELGASS